MNFLITLKPKTFALTLAALMIFSCSQLVNTVTAQNNTEPNLTFTTEDLQVHLSWSNFPQTLKQTILLEDFESCSQAAFPSPGWLNVDADGDNQKWILFDVPYNPTTNPYPANSGINCAASYSWFNGQTLTPNNYLISPPIQLTNSAMLSWAIAAQRPNYSQEHYKVRLSTTGTQISDFVHVLFEETLPAQDITWKDRIVDLSAFAGQQVYVAFVHTQTTDLFAIKLDDIHIYKAFPFDEFQVLRDNELIFTSADFQTDNYTDILTEAGQYNYQVKAVYGDFELSTNTVEVNLQQGVYKLSFGISQTNGEIINDAIISLNGEAQAAGTYSFYLPQGSYQYEVSKQGFESISGEVELTNQNLHINLVLMQLIQTGILGYTLNGNNVSLQWSGFPETIQDVLFFESFEDCTPMNFPPADWLNIDHDNDGEKWILFDVPYNPSVNPYPAYTGDFCAASYSWFNGSTLTPNNFLITPTLQIPEGANLGWAIAAQRPNYSQEHYKVLISNTGNQPQDFTQVLFEETLPEQDITWKWRSLSLENFIGQQVYIAFQHTQTTDLFAIKLDDITLSADLNLISFQIFRNDELIFDTTNPQASTFTDEALPSGSYFYQVKALYNDRILASNKVHVLIQNTYTATFNIVDEQNQNIPDATITINQSHSQTSNYVFNLNPGTYQYSIARNGFLDYTGAFDITNENISLQVVMITNSLLSHISPMPKVYPNPAQKHLNITGLPRNASISLFSIDGRCVFQQSLTSEAFTMPISGLTPGLYILEINSTSGIWSKKISIIP